MTAPRSTSPPANDPLLPAAGDALDATPSGAPPARRHTRRSETLPRRRWGLLSRLAAWLVSVAVVASVGGAIIFGRSDDVAELQQVSDREVRMTLLPGERLERSAHVAQRHVLDYFRRTHGTLAATDRRLIFVGVLPRDLVEPASEPPAFDVRTFRYDTAFAARPTRVFFGRTAGIVVGAPGEDERFGVARADVADAEAVLASARRHVATVRQSVARELAAVADAATRAPIREYHDVKRGETLIGIAERYGVTPDSIQFLNALAAPRIIAGQRILVREYRDTTVYYRDTLQPGRRY